MAASRPQFSALILVLLASSCTAKHGPAIGAADLSAPKPAALSFLHAIARADARAAKAASVGTDQDRQSIDAIVSLIAGLRAYADALKARFGAQASSIDDQLREAMRALTDDPVMRLEGGIVKESADSAEVDPALNGVRLAARPPIYLRKDAGVWKVDLATMRNDPTYDPAATDQYRSAGKALQLAAQAIRRGRYRTLDAALAASDSIP